MIYFRAFFISMAAVFLQSCDWLNEDSDDISSESIYISAELTAKGNSATYVKVNLHKDKQFGKAIELVNGDKLSITFLGNTIGLKKDDNLVEIDYIASIDNQGQGGLYTLTFDRHDGSSISSTVIMPEPFTIDSPAANTIFTQGDTVNVTWSPVSPSTEIDFHGRLSCHTYEDDLSRDTDSENENWSTSDDGEYALPLGELISNLTFEVFFEDERFNYSIPCSLEFDMSRTNHGNLSGQYVSDSTLTATQYRKVNKMSVILIND